MTTANHTPPADQPKRMTVFRASEGREGYDKMPFEGIDESVIAGYGKLAEVSEYAEQGQIMRTLFAAPGEQGFSLTYAWFKSGFMVPRHSHNNSDCMYYVLGGEMHLGNQVLNRGDGVFVPTDTPYSFQAGPEGVEILEFRNATQFHFLFGRNDEAYWDKMADAIRTNGPNWKNETVPPSQRSK
jgi:quercetin dioxygenase-like cupin family protein